MENVSKFIQADESQNKIMDVPFSSNQKYHAALYAISSNMIEGWEPSKLDVLRVRQQTDEIFKKYDYE